MKQEKAREFYSEYFEGTLEPGLRQAFEQTLASNAQIRAEYDDFAETIRGLSFLRDEQIEIPISLSDRIATGLELAETQKHQRSWSPRNWLIGLGLAGVATAAVVGGIMSFGTRGNNAVAGGFAGNLPESDVLRVVANKGQVTCSYRPSTKKTIVVSMANGKTLKQIESQGRLVEIPLQNPNAKASVFRIDVVGDASGVLVAIPGTASTKLTTGRGNVSDFIAAVADRYHTPISAQSIDSRRQVAWTFGPDAITSVNRSLSGTGMSVEQHADEMLSISDH